MRGPSARRDNNERMLQGLARFRSMSLLCAMQMVFLPVFSVRLQAQTANVIVPDGRTGTALQTSGGVTNVTTSTVAGVNAFNSFSQFSVGQGNTVNLQLPTGTQNLVNIVRDAPVYVNGTLNSYMNGAIGGNVYFADPKGFVVGRSGTVNVGSLNVSTPTREFTDSLIGPGGAINGTAVGNLMAGSFPVSPDGNVRIYGRINAIDGVRLTGQNVLVGGASQRDIANLDHAAKFAASVNSKGLRSASAITVSNGSIHIGAVNNATVNGRLTARSKTTTPSTIAVVAGNNAEIGKNAKLSTASRTGDAGGVLVKAGNDLTVKSGAAINAGSKTGNAGLVELSGNGVIDIGSGVSINLSAPNGKAGTLVIDPTDVVIGDAGQGDAGVTLSNTSVANAIAALSAGATYVVQADNSITLAAHAVIDARRLDVNGHSTGNANNVELDAKTISIVDGAKILAQAVNSGTSYTDGSVTLAATASQTLVSGHAYATTGITVDGQITGGNISIGATSTAVSNMLSSTAGLFAMLGETVAGLNLGVNAGYVAASATANVAINGHANISASGNVLITATGSETAADPVLASTIGGGLPFGASAVVGNVIGNVSANVASNATISAGGYLNITSTNNATVNVAAIAATTSAAVVATFAYTNASVTTNANVETGAHLSAGTASGSAGGLAIYATNNNSFSTSATSVALDNPALNGNVGGAMAMSNINTSANATLGSSLGTSANPMTGPVTVNAVSNTTSNSTMASTITGTPTLIAGLQGVLAVGSAPTSIIVSQMTSTLLTADLNLKASAALTLANSTENATAAIATNPNGGAPSIYTTGNVAVVSNVTDVGVRNNSTTAAITSSPINGQSYAVSAAVAWGNYTHNSNAYIGEGVTINAPNIGVAANTSMPITNTWTQWAGLTEVLSHLNGSLGVSGNIITSYANAGADAGDTLGISGSLNNFIVHNNTTAWVATDANLNATCTVASCGSGAWTANLNNGTQAFDATLAVTANSYTASIDVAGNIGTFGFIGNTSGGSSFGGSLNLVQLSNNTIAGVAANATVKANDNISVEAVTTDQFFGVAPTSGKAQGSLALNGITSIALVDNTTHASIGAGATVEAPTVNIYAAQDLSMLSIAGAVSISANSAVGLAVAYLGATADTAAYIGDNSSDIRGGAFNVDDPFSGTSGGSGSVKADNLIISATTSGRITAASIAAAISEPGVSSFATKAGAVTSAATGGTAGVAAGASQVGAKSGSSTSGFSIDLAGSSSVSDVSLGTSAYIKNAGTIDKYTTTSLVSTKTLVQALNDTILDNGSGSAAANMAGSEDRPAWPSAAPSPRRCPATTRSPVSTARR